MTKESAYKLLKERLQFVFVLTLFFPTMLAAFFSTSHQEELDKNIVMYGLTIFCLILTYLYVEVLKTRIHAWLITTCNVLLLINVSAFAPIFYIFAAVQKGSISPLFLVPFGMGILGILLIPLGLFMALAVTTGLLQIKDIGKDMRSILHAIMNVWNKKSHD